MKEIAARYDVGVRFKLTEYARSDVEKLQGEVRARADKLQSRGSELYSLSGHVEGPVWLVVGVLANAEAAREVLADLGPQIQVELVGRNVPL